MRTDLTPAFLTEMTNNGNSPRQLAVFHFQEAGDVFVSDVAVGVSDGLNNDYSSLVEDWGVLKDMAGGDVTDHRAGEIEELTITLWNGGTSPFSNYFLFEAPENVVVDVYQWYEGLTDADKALIGTFLVQEPINFSEASYLLSLDLVSIFLKYNSYVGDILKKADWPNARATDLGKGIDLIIGEPGKVKLLAARVPAETKLSESVLSGSSVLSVDSTAGFTSSGVLLLEGEKIAYTGISGNSFTGTTRGYAGTTAAEHLTLTPVSQAINNYTFLIGRGPVKSISDIQVGGGGNLAPYVEHLTLNPARIVFSERPYSERFAASPTFLSMQFDDVAADNTALQAHYAFDPESTEVATIQNPSNSLLSIQQTTVNPDRGQIMKCYLAVEHFESEPFLSDAVNVIVDGIGTVGQLSRPAEVEGVTIDAEVDINHGHSHKIGREHTHSFTDPILSNNDAGHSHGLDGISTETSVTPTGVLPRNHSVKAAGSSFPGLLLSTVSYTGLPATHQTATMVVRFIGSNVQLTVKDKNTGVSHLLTHDGIDYTIGFGSGVSSGGVHDFEFQWRNYNKYAYTATLVTATYSVIADSSVQPNVSSVTTAVAVSGANANTDPNQADDVNDLVTTAQPVAVTQAAATTRTFVNLFDITPSVDFQWPWFTGRKVRLQYSGTSDNKKVYVLNVFFDIEYRPKEIVYSDELTATVSGLVDSSNNLINNPAEVRQYLLCDIGGMSTGLIDTTTKASLKTVYGSLNYRFDGVIKANSRIKEVEKWLAFQCRSRWFWSGGKAKFALRQNLSGLSAARDLTSDDYRLKSFAATRQRTTDLVNKLVVAYNRDHTDTDGGIAAYQALSTGQNTTSIAEFGTLENRDGFLFDMVAQQSMADDLKDFYLENLATASTFYQFDTYLNNFDLEKEDCISLTSNFGKLMKALGVVRSASRNFGSGKLTRVNFIRVVAEVARYLFVSKSLADSVTISDSIQIDFGLDVFLEELAAFVEKAVFDYQAVHEDYVSVADAVSIVADFDKALSESVSAVDSQIFNLSVSLSDSVAPADSIAPQLVFGFGVGGFGGGVFGGVPVIVQTSAESTLLEDVIALFLSTVFSATVTVSEDLYFTAGFGGNDITDGFGGGLYGS